jgi:dephospho-CoA kinase
LNAKLLAFGDYVRMQAKKEGLDPNNRPVLQDLGQRLASNPATFVEDALLWAGHRTGDRCIIDGVRHQVVWNELMVIGRRTNEATRLIFLDVPEQERRRRLQARGLEADAMTALDNHPSERDIRSHLYREADLRLDGEQTPEYLAELVARSLAAR